MLTEDFDIKFDHYNDVKHQSGLLSVWSIFEVENINDLSGLEAESLVYKDHWGHDQAVSVPLPEGNIKWWDLWVAANKAIIESTDLHHIFIEDFQKSPDGKTLFLRTGS
jgi:hypothetical protein